MENGAHVCLSVGELMNLINRHESEKHAMWEEHIANCANCRERFTRLLRAEFGMSDVFDWIDGTKRILH